MYPVNSHTLSKINSAQSIYSKPNRSLLKSLGLVIFHSTKMAFFPVIPHFTLLLKGKFSSQRPVGLVSLGASHQAYKSVIMSPESPSVGTTNSKNLGITGDLLLNAQF